MTKTESNAQLYKLALDGNLDELLALVKGQEIEEEEGDAEAYKWLLVASDCGHEDEAEEFISALTEGTSLHDDDGGRVKGGIHYELARAYLGGKEGIPLDLEKGEVHLRQSVLELRYLQNCDVGDGVESHRAELSGGARAVFDAVIPPATRAAS